MAEIDADGFEEGLETGRITIRSAFDDDGHLCFYTHFSEGLGYVETLGLLEAAKDTASRWFMGEDDED